MIRVLTSTLPIKTRSRVKAQSSFWKNKVYLLGKVRCAFLNLTLPFPSGRCGAPPARRPLSKPSWPPLWEILPSSFRRLLLRKPAHRAHVNYKLKNFLPYTAVLLDEVQGHWCQQARMTCSSSMTLTSAFIVIKWFSRGAASILVAEEKSRALTVVRELGHGIAERDSFR